MESPVTTARARDLTVRFEDSCVLIPPSEVPKPGIRPRLVTKSYSLPLWKTTPAKKTASATALSESDAAAADKGDKKPFSLTVSVPRLTTTKSKPRRPSLPPSPCLSKRSSPASPASDPPLPHVHESLSPPPLVRAPTFPAIEPAGLREAATVPLRPCCLACHRCVDAALAEGERWAEKWSSGAKRRYSEGEHAKLHARPVFGVTREWTPSGPDVPLATALQVDEVEVKRRVKDPQDGACAHESALADSDEDPAPPAMPVQEPEDENMLFPLPKRSPNPSPDGTPISGSQDCLVQPVLDTLPRRPPSALAPETSFTPTPFCEPFVAASPNPDCPVASQIHTSGSRTSPQSDSGSPTHRRSPSQPPAPPRRLSFTSASGSLLKGSAALLKGVATGMTGASVGVMR